MHRFENSFKDPTSAQYLPPNSTFEKPPQFDEHIANIKQAFRLN